MTTIACWFNKEESRPTVWASGDSKVSASNETTLIESSPKIFSLPVRCFLPSERGFFERLVLNTTIGVAYAGNSLVGLTFSSALTTCLGHLSSPSKPPSLDEIAEFSRKLLQMYVKQLGFVVGSSALCEIAVLGFCPIEGQAKICHLIPRIEQSQLEYDLRIYSESDPDDFVLLLGVDRKRIAQAIREYRQGREKDISWWRTPKTIIASEVKSPQNSTIGGHLQLGIGDQLGFQVYSVCQPYGTGPAAYLSYLGLDVSADFGRIGPCMVGMPGMA